MDVECRDNRGRKTHDRDTHGIDAHGMNVHVVDTLYHMEKRGMTHTPRTHTTWSYTA